MSKVLVKAVDPKGHWALGRYWPHSAPVELEIVEPVDAEIPSANDGMDVGAKKHQMRADRLNAGKATESEIAFIREYSHLVEIQEPKCAKCDALTVRIQLLEAELKKAKR